MTPVFRRLLPIAALTLVVPAVGSAQDVEALGERYGTPVPEAYRRVRGADPAAFNFQRGWAGRGADRAFFEGAAASGPALGLGPRPAPVVGTFEIPVLLGMYSNSGGTPPFPTAEIQEEYFGAGTGTITDYYSEVSGGRATLLGDVYAWVQAPRPDTSYTVGESGLVSGSLGGGGAGNFVWDLLQLNTGVDWGPYDNDGPDGIPNSGDDDGFVDVLAVIHPTRGGECGGSGSADRIWSHRWSLSSAVFTPFETNTPSSSGGFIKVDDYTIQPSISCSGGVLSQIGVFTHELGHAFGLPDLYDTDTGNGRHAGAGIWDLMASGSWGCNNSTPESPCHLGAWSKAALGWVDVTTLAPDADHGTLTLPPVETASTVYRVDATDGSDEYYLIENRQRIGYDTQLYAEGLLVWQIDDGFVQSRWPANRVNADAHMGVWLRQADGRDDLGVTSQRGDAGDPFPGQTGNAVFHSQTNPGPFSFEGTFAGLTVFDIAPSGDDMQFRLLTRMTTITVRAEGASAPEGLFTVDGQAVDPPATTFVTPPFTPHTVEAVAGEAVAPGERRPFVAWQDDPGAPRVRSIVATTADEEFVAQYGGTQYQLALSTTGGVNGVTPGTFTSTPASTDFWFDAGTAVSLQAQPRTGFSFASWSGAATGQGNPASLTLDGPLVAAADFDLIYAVTEATVALPAATPLDVQLQIENGTAPVTWTLVAGSLPTGLALSRSGRITGSALELGSFVLTVQAVDALGLPDTGVLTMDLTAPAIPLEQLTSTFLLNGEPLSPVLINFLNWQGNRTAPYDIGDFRAWILANPTAPLSADLTDGIHRRTIVIRGTTGGREGAR